MTVTQAVFSGGSGDGIPRTDKLIKGTVEIGSRLAESIRIRLLPCWEGGTPLDVSVASSGDFELVKPTAGLYIAIVFAGARVVMSEANYLWS